MTTQEIYTVANETTEAQFNNLFNGLSELELINFNTLVSLCDKKEVALWTLISKRYEKVEGNDFYTNAYNK